MEVGVAIKWQHEDPCGDGNILQLDCFSVNMLVMLHCASVRCYPWEELGPLCVISYNCKGIYNYLKIKSATKK